MASVQPQLWVLTGGNGAGKSTFFDQRLRHLGIPFINADEIAKKEYPDDPEGASYKAAKKAELVRMRALSERRSFCFETVFSHHSKVDFLGAAKAVGYQIILVYIHLSEPELNVARVVQRAIEGGHSVPEDKILSRIPRTMANVRAAINLCDLAYILDNSDLSNPFQQVVTVVGGVSRAAIQPLPGWAEGLLCHPQ